MSLSPKNLGRAGIILFIILAVLFLIGYVFYYIFTYTPEDNPPDQPLDSLDNNDAHSSTMIFQKELGTSYRAFDMLKKYCYYYIYVRHQTHATYT